MALTIIKLLYESREVVFKLFNDLFNCLMNYSILSEAKYIKIHGKWIPSMSAHVSRLAKALTIRIFNHSNLKISSPKQML